MGTRGRPTRLHPDGTTEGPGFRERPFEEVVNPEANPYLREHREYGVPLLTTEQTYGYRGRWDECFGRKAPLYLEIGCGNGFFFAELCRRNPDVNVLGIEIRYKRTVLTARKLDKAGVKNGRIARYHGAYLADLFDEGELDMIFVNHPDPWPKHRHEKNRLISRWFLEDVARYLRPGGRFQLKSDFQANVSRVPELLSADAEGNPAPTLPLQITGQSDDIINGPAPWPDDIETNYQSKYRRKGEPVYAIELTRA